MRYGHVTLRDGTHVPLSEEAATAFWKSAEGQRAARKEDMPTEADALRQFHQAYTRLCEIGWKAPCYAHHMGECDVISLGSSGVHRATYSGQWPTGDWWLRADFDTIEPALVKPLRSPEQPGPSGTGENHD